MSSISPVKSFCAAHFLSQNATQDTTSPSDLYLHSNDYYGSCAGVMKSLTYMDMDPKTKLRDASISYWVLTEKKSLKGELYTEPENISFKQQEITVGTFSKFLQCSDPKLGNSLEATQRCWNKAYPT